MFKRILLITLLLSSQVSIFAESVKRKPKAGKYKDYNPRKSLFNFGGGVSTLALRGNIFENISKNESVLIYKSVELKENPLLFNLAISKPIPIRTANNQWNIGIEPVVNLYYGKGKVVNQIISGDVSSYFYVKYGAGSTIENEEYIGYGVGIGYTAKAYRMESDIDELVYLKPSAYFELRMRQRNDVWHLRLFADISAYKYLYPSYLGDLQGPTFRMIGIQLLRD